ncbi:transcriptional regulator [Nakamurella antarctica]|uniref:Transcriptional regulator n=1 Tax=Nakamurella antarctica TaxID=1902245 RepID=A0A3G8ZQ52_9ACTN|nr:transcriptional regulator [Nakamurella antarctica]
MARRRDQVLHRLRDSADPLTVTDLAGQLAIHVNTVRFHLGTLVSAGQVETVRAAQGGAGRPPQLFRPVRGMDPRGRRDYQVLAGVLAITLANQSNPAQRSAEAGRAWGSKQRGGAAGLNPLEVTPLDPADAVIRLTDMLDEFGFSPEQPPNGVPSHINLRNCPFLELAVDRPDVVCSIHLGIMQGAIEAWSASLAVERLEPFAAPDLCVVHLSVIDAP